MAGIITNAVRKKVDELRVLQFTSLQTCLEDKERADEVSQLMCGLGRALVCWQCVYMFIAALSRQA